MVGTRRRWMCLMILALAPGCSEGEDRRASAATAATEPAPPAPAPDPDSSAEPEVPAPEPIDAAPPLAGHDFIAEARVLYRVAACAGDEPLPAHIDTALVEGFCKRFDKRKDAYRERYLGQARTYLQEIIPDDLPAPLVYPFGGGDLISALVAFPDRPEITTLSLELAGDPRRIMSMGRARLQSSLTALGAQIGGMLSVSSNTSANLSESQQNDLPGQLTSFLIGLAVAGYEPVSVRYFRIEDDGSLHYLTLAEIEALDDESARNLRKAWLSPNFSPAFKHVEIRFRASGEPDAPVQVHRHIAWDLSDGYLKRNPQVLAHLRGKGKVTAMTKGASYVLWRSDFSTIRDYLLSHMAWMLSDSTGIPPLHARAAGFEQLPIGRFAGSFLGASEKHNDDFRALWQQSPHRPLPFRFGYVDSAKQAHLLITRPRGAAR